VLTSAQSNRHLATDVGRKVTDRQRPPRRGRRRARGPQAAYLYAGTHWRDFPEIDLEVPSW